MTQTRDTVCKVYHTALEEIAELEPADKRCRQHLYAYIQLIRFQSLPSLTTHVSCSTRQTIQLEGKWTETLNHERFLLADDGDADQHIIIFATDQMLHRLQCLKLRKYFRGQVGPHQINFGSPHNLLGAHQACSAPATSIARCPMAGGPLKAPGSPGINGVKSCILAISLQQNWPFRN